MAALDILFSYLLIFFFSFSASPWRTPMVIWTDGGGSATIKVDWMKDTDRNLNHTQLCII